MIEYYVHRGGRTTRESTLDPSWLRPGSGVKVWADVQQPTEADADTLRDVFGLHPLAVEGALQATQHPKVEPFPGMLAVVLHGINFHPESDSFDTHDTDFFLTREFLVTVHDGQRRSVQDVCRLCLDNDAVFTEGTAALMHRIVDRMVDHYRPEVDEIEERLDRIEDDVIEGSAADLTRDILTMKRDIASMRRIVLPQRDIVGRLSRREFEIIDQDMSYRFRDVFDQLVRMSDEAMIFQERVTGILDAHLAAVSNQLARSSQRLAAVATIFGTLTVITGVYGMNVTFPGLPVDSQAPFWIILGFMAAVTMAFILWFKHRDWF